MTFSGITPKPFVYTLAAVSFLDGALRVSRSLSPKIYRESQKCKLVKDILSVTSVLCTATMMPACIPRPQHLMNISPKLGLIFKPSELMFIYISSFLGVRAIETAKKDTLYKKFMDKEKQARNIEDVRTFSLTPSIRISTSFFPPLPIYKEKAACLTQAVCLTISGLFLKEHQKLFIGLAVWQLTSFIAYLSINFVSTVIELQKQNEDKLTLELGNPIFGPETYESREALYARAFGQNISNLAGSLFRQLDGVTSLKDLKRVEILKANIPTSQRSPRDTTDITVLLGSKHLPFDVVSQSLSDLDEL